ncbi:MAG: hypothetical protein AAFU50_05580 [Pseudomonadota bacterium]
MADEQTSGAKGAAANSAPQQRAWWEASGIRKRIMVALLALGGALVLLQPFLKKDAKFAIEALPGLYGLLAVAGSAAVVVLAVILRRAFEREEDYYDQ